MEKNRYLIVDGRWTKASKWMIFKHHLKQEVKRWKLVDSFNNRIIPLSEIGRYFSMSPKEKEEADKLYKEKGTLEYHFYPCGGIGWGLRVKVVKTGEEIDITDTESW